MFDLDKALQTVAKTRRNKKYSKETRMMFKIFDEKYGERVKNGGSEEVSKILFELVDLVS